MMKHLVIGAARGLARGFGRAFSFVLAFCVLFYAGMVTANYLATQGSGTSFASVVISSTHYLANMLCDFSVGQTACATVKPASTASISTDTSVVTQLNPTSPGLIPVGQTTMASSVPVVVASDQSGISVTVSNVNANGQATMANSSPVAIASDQGAFAVNAQPSPVTSGGLTNYFVQPTASDNHVNIKNGAGQVYKVVVTNNSSTVNYLRLYNAATGFNGCNSATNLVYQIAIPALVTVGGIADSWNMGLAFSTGISICVTSGYATNDTTNATASAMSVNIGYK